MQTVWSCIALACLLAGADAFGVMPEPGHPTCDHGHTGDLAVLSALGGNCGMVSPGHDDDPNNFDCEHEDGSDGNYGLGIGQLAITFKDVCPETCGAPCGHAPTEDNDAVAGGFADVYPGADTCMALADAGGCEAEMLINWFCGASCRGGGPWDECMWLRSPWHGTTQEHIEADCADPQFVASYGYQDVDACVDDSVANWVANATGHCPGDMDPSDGVDCYYDTHLANTGSTEVHKCPGVRRRKLTRSGTHSGAMKTKGEFVALAASGSK